MLGRLLCRIGWHDLYVRWRNQETPLWASRYLLALMGTRGCTLFCKRCAFSEGGVSEEHDDESETFAPRRHARRSASESPQPTLQLTSSAGSTT